MYINKYEYKLQTDGVNYFFYYNRNVQLQKR